MRSISDYKDVPKQRLEILQNLDVPVNYSGDYSELPTTDLILDAIIGYILRGAPQGQAANLIRLANSSGINILSLDVPSGLDSTSGKTYDPHIQSKATLTLALPKVGLLGKSAKRSVGELYLADISVPSQLYANIGLHVGPIFTDREILKL